jgi:hypothetical protein
MNILIIFPLICHLFTVADIPCGQSPTTISTLGRGDLNLRDGRIIGGRNAEHGEFPWTISLQNGKDGAHFCGGVILDRYHILTAGHCFIVQLYG